MPIGTLDYEPTRLEIEITTAIEEGWRRWPVKKEKWTADFIDSIPEGSIFWDLGACVGSYTLIGVARGLNVVAVEPHPTNYATLSRNLALNNFLDRVALFSCAVGPARGWCWLHIQDMRSGAGGHIVGQSERDIYYHKMLIPVRPWDELLADLPWRADVDHYAKVDVEGGELAILDGATEMLTRLRSVMVEMRLDFEEQVTKRLAAAGLKLAARYDQRANGTIVGVAYGRYERG